MSQNPPGLPRRRAQLNLSELSSPGREDWHGRCLRFPWVNAGCAADPRWLSFRADAHVAHVERLCAVCGHPAEANLVYLNYEELPRSGEQPRTSGPGTHPVCALIAISDCPHLAEQLRQRGFDTVIAWLWTGTGQAYEYTGPLSEVYDDERALTCDVTPLTLTQLIELCRDTAKAHWPVP